MKADTPCRECNESKITSVAHTVAMHLYCLFIVLKFGCVTIFQQHKLVFHACNAKHFNTKVLKLILKDDSLNYTTKSGRLVP